MGNQESTPPLIENSPQYGPASKGGRIHTLKSPYEKPEIKDSLKNCFEENPNFQDINELYNKRNIHSSRFNTVKDYERNINPFYKYYKIYAIFNMGENRPYHFCAKFSAYSIKEVNEQIATDKSHYLSDDALELGERIRIKLPYGKNLKDVIEPLIDQNVSILSSFLKDNGFSEEDTYLLHSLTENLKYQNNSRQPDLLISHVAKGEDFMELQQSIFQPAFGKDKITVQIGYGQLNDNITLSVLKNTCLSWWYKNDIIYGGDQFPSSCSGSVFCIVGKTSQSFLDKVSTWKSNNPKSPLKEYLYNLATSVYEHKKDNLLQNLADQPRGRRGGNSFGKSSKIIKKSTRKSTRKPKKSTRKSIRKPKKSTRKSIRKPKKSTRKSTRKPKKSNRKSTRKPKKSNRKSTRKLK